MKVRSLVRPNILKLKPFSSARAEYSGEAEVLLDANESPFRSDINRYPDPYHSVLRKMISELKKVKTSNIILGNGSDELLDLTVRTFCEPGEDIVRYIHPSFGMYEVVADVNNVKKEAVALTSDFDLDPDYTLSGQTPHHKVLFLCSPNNPTGNCLDRDKLLQCIRDWSGIVVVDEAYIDFADAPSLIAELDHFDNLIIIQTLSKAYGAAGLRLGVGYASEEIISYLIKIKPPYNVNSISQTKAMALIADANKVNENIRKIVVERNRMKPLLDGLDSTLKVFRSDANFFLVRFRDHTKVKICLMKEGIIVRDRSSLPGCEGCLRITLGTRNENEQLIESLRNYDKNEESTFY